jgi:hypothetical protein
MSGTAKSFSITGSSGQSTWRERWHLLREFLGGALVLVVWAALWTGVWAAVAGPLSPIHADARPKAVETGDESAGRPGHPSAVARR